MPSAVPRAFLLPLFVVALFGQVAEDAGPSILSRGEGGGTTPSGGISFRPFINVSGIFDHGMMGATVDPNGHIIQDSLFGGEVAAGLYGYKGWKKTTLGVNYRFDYRGYNSQSSYSGSDQFLMLGVTHRVSPHFQVSVREGAGTYTHSGGFGGTFGYFDPSFAQIPRDELIDNRIYYFSGMADATYMKSARLSFNFGVTGFTVRRRMSGLYSMTGASARGDVAYRVTRHSTLGVDYLYTQFSYNKAFGSADMHSVGLDYSVQLSPRWTIGLRGGAVRAETLMLRTVAIDPIVAAIIGTTTGLRAYYGLNYGTSVGAQLTRSFGRSSASVSFNRGVTPGNGIYLTADQTEASATYAYTGMRRWSLTAGSRYSDMQSIGQDIGRYRAGYADAGAARSISSRNIFLTFRFSVRYVGVQNGLSRTPYTATIGVAYSPGDIPLQLW